MLTGSLIRLQPKRLPKVEPEEQSRAPSRPAGDGAPVPEPAWVISMDRCLMLLDNMTIYRMIESPEAIRWLLNN